MGNDVKRYWQHPAELEGPRAAPRADEFVELLPLGPEARHGNRRDFLRLMGLSSAAALAACTRAPVHRLIPFATQPDDVVPGVPSFYAGVCGGCAASCGALVKVRDGRPIKLEGNDRDPWSRGGLCAVGQASVLSLYDATRARGPWRGEGKTTWPVLDAAVAAGLAKAQASGRAIRLVTPPHLGPTGEALVARFLAAFGAAKRVRHDPLGGDAIAEAHRLTHGALVMPTYRFDRARRVASFGADFLGTWLSPVAFTRQLATSRDPASHEMGRLYQLEPALSLTGSNADHRWAVAPSETVATLAALATRLGVAGAAMPAPALSAARLDALAADLRGARGAALVVSGSDEVSAQVLVNAVNEALGAYGTTVDLAGGVPLADALTMGAFEGELRAGSVGAVIVLGVNPVYDHPRGAELAALLAKVELTVSTADRRDETARRLGWLAPDHHRMESWSDSQPVGDLVGVSQPVIAPLGDTRGALESLLVWSGAPPRTTHALLRERWEAEVMPRTAPPALSFDLFWQRSVQDGFARVRPVEVDPAAAPRYRPEAALALTPPPASPPGLELALAPSLALHAGRLANNAWLQELPDPITKVTWGNVAAIAPSTAARLGLSDGDLVTVTAGDRSITLPALAQPGVHPGVVAVALGHGRDGAGPVAARARGADAFPLALEVAGRSRLWRGGVTLRGAGGHVELARTQTHHSMEGRPLVRERRAGEHAQHAAHEAHEAPSSMWPAHEYNGHRWAMAIDLHACTGCSACVVACQAENNIPSVGEDEVRRRREMHWLRIDRYYAGSPDEPEVVHQPMLCQHCENAPCETVCPVLATVHSSEGLNQQVYNRCVGTRYCANNCPVKTRRFNWFDYRQGEDPVGRLVLNPDVVVRSRGVMEKCSLCVQRIQAAKTRARLAGRAVSDDDVQTACQQTCPAGAIVMGDLNDPKSRVAALVKDGRAYRILEQLNIRSSVSYLEKVRNPGRGV